MTTTPVRDAMATDGRHGVATVRIGATTTRVRRAMTDRSAATVRAQAGPLVTVIVRSGAMATARSGGTLIRGPRAMAIVPPAVMVRAPVARRGAATVRSVATVTVHSAVTTTPALLETGIGRTVATTRVPVVRSETAIGRSVGRVSVPSAETTIPARPGTGIAPIVVTDRGPTALGVTGTVRTVARVILRRARGVTESRASSPGTLGVCPVTVAPEPVRPVASTAKTRVRPVRRRTAESVAPRSPKRSRRGTSPVRRVTN